MVINSQHASGEEAAAALGFPQKLSRGHRGGEILIPIIYQLPVSGKGGGNVREEKSPVKDQRAIL